MIQNSTPDPELTLTINSAHGGWEAVVAPHGASLRGLDTVDADGARREVITGYTGAQQKAGGQGDVLIPFPGRIASGAYTFGGQALQMDKNDKDGPNAIKTARMPFMALCARTSGKPRHRPRQPRLSRPICTRANIQDTRLPWAFK